MNRTGTFIAGVVLAFGLGFVWCVMAKSARAAPPSPGPDIVLVTGAAGSPEYAEMFSTWASRWQHAATSANAHLVRIGTNGTDISNATDTRATDFETLRDWIATDGGDAASPLWIVMIGHGTYYRDIAKFNLTGPDVSAQQLSTWLAPLQCPVIVINCASGSGPFIQQLKSEGRVIVTSTKSGSEQNFARFGDYISTAITDGGADLDHDQQLSLLEVFLHASKRVAKFYQDDDRLITETALLDDNGDGLGTPASFFRGIHPVAKTRNGAPLDGRRASSFTLIPGAADRQLSDTQRAQRNAIESRIAALRDAKGTMDENDYYQQLELLLVPLAELYAE